MIGAPHPDMSPIRSAGRLLISTVVLPIGNGVGGCGGVDGIEHTCMSPTTAAGIPPISTVGTPGPWTTPGCPVGISSSPPSADGHSSQLIFTSEPCTVATPLVFTSTLPLPSSLAWRRPWR